MRYLKIVVALALFAYLSAATYLFVTQRSLLFRPDVTRITPAEAGVAQAQEVLLNRRGAPDLLAWWIPPKDEKAPVFVYLHGNAANIARRSGRLTFLAQDGSGVLAVSWRGYGGSAGSPSEEGFREDARQALAFLAANQIPSERVILFGESLGTGIAVMTAAETPVKALILDSPYDSIQAIAQNRYWWLPVGLLMRDPFRADLAAPLVKAPTIVIQCQEDWATPFENGRKLFSLLTSPKRTVLVPRRCHVPPLSDGGGAAITTLLTDLENGAAIR